MLIGAGDQFRIGTLLVATTGGWVVDNADSAQANPWLSLM